MLQRCALVDGDLLEVGVFARHHADAGPGREFQRALDCGTERVTAVHPPGNRLARIEHQPIGVARRELGGQAVASDRARVDDRAAALQLDAEAGLAGDDPVVDDRAAAAPDVDCGLLTIQDARGCVADSAAAGQENRVAMAGSDRAGVHHRPAAISDLHTIFCAGDRWRPRTRW